MVSKVTFPQEDNIILVATNFVSDSVMQGNLYRVRFNQEKGGEAKEVTEF